jgi:xylulokinase
MSHTSDYVLAIDLGSSGPKVSLVNDRGELVASTSRRIATLNTPDGGGEQDPEDWWRSVRDCARELVAGAGIPRERINAISCATQWSVTVPVDRHGRHLMNAIHWSDSRGGPYSQQLTDGLIKVAGYGLGRMLRWVKITGGVPAHSGADALSHILYIKHARPDVYRDTAALLEPMDYLNLRLTGRAAATYATVFPYLLTDNRDNTRIEYDPRLLRWSGIDRAKLPDLVPQGTVLGTILPEIAAEWDLAPTTQVIAGTPDSQAAALGSGAVRDYEGHICLGTTAWLSCHVPFKRTNLLNYLATMPSALLGRNMVMAEQGAAGKCLQTFVERWLCAKDELSDIGAPDDVYDRIERLAARVPAGSGGLLFLPWLNGAGPPSGESEIRGGFLNQSLSTGRAEATRAILEGVAMNLAWLRGAVERFIRRPFDGLNFIGGGARSDTWAQIMADVVGCPIRRMAEPEMAISRGAAMVAWRALGRSSGDDLGQLARVERVFHPDPANRRVYQALFAEFLSSYKANRGMFRRLNRRPKAGHRPT